MGTEIAITEFEEQSFENFRKKLLLEATVLQQLAETNLLENNSHSIGTEIEAWIVDKEGRPKANNEALLNCINNPQVVTELSKYNIEINGTPIDCGPNHLMKMQKELERIWEVCVSCAQQQNSKLALIGTLPTAMYDDFTMDHLAIRNRYSALNNALFSHAKKHEIHIKGDKDSLQTSTEHIMPASAATSMQYHWLVPFNKFDTYFNCVQMFSFVTTALGANAPLLFGKQLWHESRVPLFEHAINSAPSSKSIKPFKRSFFGKDYLKNGVVDFFKSNIQDFPVLLPVELSKNPSDFSHTNLHNGTIWRWNRPVIGQNSEGQTHVRIEHRAPSAGPTIADGMANFAFFLGLVQAWVNENKSQLIPFRWAEHNFYRSAQKGLQANVLWGKGPVKISDLLINEFLPLAKNGLVDLGFSGDEISYYLDEIIFQRVANGQTGAQWQKDFLDKHSCLKLLTNTYLENQMTGRPVHLWKV